MGPIEIIYCWQALLCAAAAWGVTQLAKTALDTVYEKKHGTSNARRRSLIVTRVVLPVIPVMAGLAYGVLVPLRPTVLDEYVAEHVSGSTMALVAYGAWGAACGQFSTFLYDRLKKLITQARSDE